MLKAWLLVCGVAIAGLLAASCAATPQSAATAYATDLAAAAATQAYAATTQKAESTVQQAYANAVAGHPTPVPGWEGKKLIIHTKDFVFIQQPDGHQTFVRMPPQKPTYPNGDPKY